MTKQKSIILLAALLLMSMTAVFLAQFRGHQKLGAPGVKTTPLPGGQRLLVELPAKVLDYESKLIEPDPVSLGALPADTSFGQRYYKAPDGFETLLNVVLMGADRTSLHKPQFCLNGQGWQIDQSASAEAKISVDRPYPYELPVVKLVSTKEFTENGQTVSRRGVYVYWYVADHAISASTSGIQRMWWMAREFARTGVLQRWAYISQFAVCRPGEEDATFERMKKFIAASVPEYQLTPGPTPAVVSALR